MDFTSIITNQRMQVLIAENFNQVIKQALGVDSTLIEYKIVEDKNEVETKAFGLLRYFFSKKSYFLIVGSSDEKTIDFFKSIETSKLLDLETRLLNSLDESIVEVVKALNNNIEMKSTLVVPEDQVGIFNTIEVTQSFKVKLSINNQLICIEVPLASKAYLSSALLQKTGLSDQSRILIVDDSKLIRLILKNYLSAAGLLFIDEAIDGKEALQKIKKTLNGYHLIVADWHMPEMNGLELLREVRLNPVTKSTPFILATSEQKKEEILEAVKLKVSGYVVKPYSAELLFKSVKSVIDKSGH